MNQNEGIQVERIKLAPEVGDIVLYRVSASDASELRHNHHADLPTLPAVVVRVWTETTVNLKVWTDGPTDVWVTSAMRGDGAGEWEFRPEIVRQ